MDKSKASDSAVMKPGTFFKNHAIKTKYGFDRVVEDLGQKAISKGDFDLAAENNYHTLSLKILMLISFT